MKYIMFEKKMDTISVFLPVLFSDKLVHAAIAKALLVDNPHTGEEAPLKSCTIRSAGFVSTELGSMTAYGESETLGIKCHPEDNSILGLLDYGGDIR